MTVAATTNRKTYAGDNVSTSFATSPVIFYNTSDLQVRVTVIATGVSTLLTLNTHYTVSGGSAAGATGAVSLAGGSSPHGALLSTEKLVILRVLPLTQASDFVENSNSSAEVLEAALDKLTDVDQQIQEQADRSIRFASGDVSGTTTELPDVTTRSGRLLGFDPLGVLITYAVQLGTSLVDLAASTGSSLIGFIQAGTGAILRTLQAKLRDQVSVFDFMNAAQIADVQARTTLVDVSAAIQAAITAIIAAGGGTLFFPPGTYLVGSTLNPTGNLSKVWFEGAGWSSILIVNAAGVNLWNFGNALSERVSFRNMSLQAGASAGHIFAPSAGVAQATFFKVQCIQNNPAKSIWNSLNTLYIDNLWEHCELQHVATATVPGFKLVSNGGDLNTNTWQRLRCTYSGNYFFWIESSTAGSYASDNVLRDINFEVCNGGCAELLSTFNALVENCTAYDITTTTKDLYAVGRSTAPGPFALFNTFRNVMRQAGTLGGGLVDIKLSTTGGISDKTTIQNVSGTSGAGVIVDLASTSQNLVLGANANTTFNNPGTTSVRQTANGGFILGDGVTTLTGRTQAAQGAVVTAANNLVLGTDGNYFQIGGATQINLLSNAGWQGGSEVTLKFNSTPTVKHNQTTSGSNVKIILNGAVDFVAAANNLLTLRYDSTDVAWYEQSRKV